MIKVDFLSEIPASIGLSQDQITFAVSDSLQKLGLKDNYILEIWFASALAIRRLNAKYRQIDKPTDVLSFPVKSIEAAEQKMLGSIVICAKILKDKDEPATDAIKHGLLHLLGYDHETDEKRWNAAANKIGCGL